MSEYDDAVQALRDMEANPDEARASLGDRYDSVLAKVKRIVASTPPRPSRSDIEGGQIRGGSPLIQLPSGSGQEGLPPEIPEGTVAESEIPTFAPAAKTNKQVIEENEKVQEVYDAQYDQSLPTMSKLREYGRPAEYQGERHPDTGATMGLATGVSAPPGVGVLGASGPGIAALHPIRWQEPSLEEFREDMRGTGWDVDQLDQNSREYKLYADKQYAKAYDDAVKSGTPIERSAFTDFARAHPTAGNALDALQAAGYGAEQMLDFGAASRLNEMAYPADRLQRERLESSHPWATFGGALGAAMLPVAPATRLGGAAAESAAGTAERFGLGPFGRRLAAGIAGGAAAGATQAAGEELVGSATGGPIDARRAIERTVTSGALGGVFGAGFGALGYGASAWNQALRRAPKGAGVGADLTRAERYLNEGKPLTGGIVGLKTPDQLKALRVQAQQQGLPSAQVAVAKEVTPHLLDTAEGIVRRRGELVSELRGQLLRYSRQAAADYDEAVNRVADDLEAFATAEQADVARSTTAVAGRARANAQAIADQASSDVENVVRAVRLKAAGDTESYNSILENLTDRIRARSGELEGRFREHVATLEPLIYKGLQGRQQLVNATIAGEKAGYYATPQGRSRVSLAPVARELWRHARTRVDQFGAPVGKPQLLQQWGRSVVVGEYVPEGQTLRQAKELSSYSDPKGFDQGSAQLMTGGEAAAMGIDIESLARRFEAQNPGMKVTERGKVLVTPRNVNAQQLDALETDLQDQFAIENLPTKEEFGSVLRVAHGLRDQFAGAGPAAPGRNPPLEIAGKTVGQGYSEMRASHAGYQADLTRDLEESGLRGLQATPSTAQRESLRKSISEYGTPSFTGRDETLARYAGSEAGRLEELASIRDLLRESGLWQGDVPRGVGSWTPGQIERVRATLKQYGYENPPETDAALRELLSGERELGQLQSQRRAAERLGMAVGGRRETAPTEEDALRRRAWGYRADPAQAAADDALRDMAGGAAPSLERVAALRDRLGEVGIRIPDVKSTGLDSLRRTIERYGTPGQENIDRAIETLTGMRQKLQSLASRRERLGRLAPPESAASRDAMRASVGEYGTEDRAARDAALREVPGLLPEDLRTIQSVRLEMKALGIGLPEAARPTADTLDKMTKLIEQHSLAVRSGESSSALVRFQSGFAGELPALDQRLELLELPTSWPPSRNAPSLEPFRKSVASYDPGLRTVRPGTAELENLAKEAGVSERLNLLGGISAFDRLQAGNRGIRPWTHLTKYGPGVTAVAQPGFFTLRSDAWRRGVSNIPPGAPGAMVGRSEEERTYRPLTPDEKIELQRMLRPGAM
jgi:hypothetical protein